MAAFTRAFENLTAAVDARREAALWGARQRAGLGRAQKTVAAQLARLETERFAERLWQKDSTLWKADDPAHQAEIRMRLGWLEVADLMLTQVAAMTDFAAEVRRAGFTHALLCGMGGSSLAPEVLRRTFGVAKGFLDLSVLDSTAPEAVLAAAARSRPERTLYIISSKSGTTTEPNAFFQYFWERVREIKGNRVGENFIAITDPGTAMERRATQLAFRRIFLNPADIGGRFSALSYFGLVPAALMGIDVTKLLERARQMALACGGRGRVAAADNPGVYLGAVMGALALASRDKLTLVISPKIAAFGCWLEQLIAESTGKEGKGIVPVEGEMLGAPEVYGRDRIFVHLRLGADARQTAALAALSRAGQPVLELRLRDAYDLGAEFLRWEIATAAAGWILNIDPFDQPNVQESKTNTVRLLQEYVTAGKLIAVESLPAALRLADAKFAAGLRRGLRQLRAGDYLALITYAAPTPRREKLLQAIRQVWRDQYKKATTLGYGPRFLHSTGQLHKGGAERSVFVLFEGGAEPDAQIPGEQYTFGVLRDAQALGDLQALTARGRRLVRVDLGKDLDAGLRQMLAAVNGAMSGRRRGGEGGKSRRVGSGGARGRSVKRRRQMKRRV